MQRFLRIYTVTLVVLAFTGSVSATEQAMDRYGNPARPVLESGDWWKAKPVLTPDEAAKHIGQFALVKGTVLDTFRTREDLYLNFGKDYKTDFTVRIPKRAWKQFGEMKGKVITVRGVIREYNGAMIVVDFKEQIHADAN